MPFFDLQPALQKAPSLRAQGLFSDFAPSGAKVRTQLPKSAPLGLFSPGGGTRGADVTLWSLQSQEEEEEDGESPGDSWGHGPGTHHTLAAQHGTGHPFGASLSMKRQNELGWTASRLTFKAAMGSSSHLTTTSIQSVSTSLFGMGSVVPIDVLAGGMAIGVDVAFFAAQLVAGKAAKHQFARRASRSTIMIGSASAAKLLLAAPVTTAVISSGLIGSSVPVGLIGLVSVGTVMTAGVGLVVAAGIGASFAIFDFMRGRTLKDQDFEIRIEVVIHRLILHRDAPIPLPAR